jgi:hypothetical protein
LIIPHRFADPVTESLEPIRENSIPSLNRIASIRESLFLFVRFLEIAFRLNPFFSVFDRDHNPDDLRENETGNCHQ